MKIQTTRFGEIEINEEEIITLPAGMLGFPDCQRYVILEHRPDSPFLWFQAVDDPSIAFVIMSPYVIEPRYRVEIKKETVKTLNITDPKEVRLYVVVSIPKDEPEKMTANFLGPIVINTRNRMARQVILENSQYTPRKPILPQEKKEEEDSPGQS